MASAILSTGSMIDVGMSDGTDPRWDNATVSDESQDETPGHQEPAKE